jgi:hypothetical protein
MQELLILTPAEKTSLKKPTFPIPIPFSMPHCSGAARIFDLDASPATGRILFETNVLFFRHDAEAE